jgi:hypothetical protein
MSSVIVDLNDERRTDPNLDRRRLQHLLRATGFRPVRETPGRFRIVLDTDEDPDEVAHMTQVTVRHFAEVAGARNPDHVATVRSVDPA